MPTMKNEPCAKLTMRVTPKISDSPAATRNNDDAPARPLSNWTTKPEKLMNYLCLREEAAPCRRHDRHRQPCRSAAPATSAAGTRAQDAGPNLVSPCVSLLSRRGAAS